MKIAIIGNAAGGKTTLARQLSIKHSIKVTHVDSIQFFDEMKIRPLNETRKILREASTASKWIIDGYGPLDLIEERFNLADKIIFIDLPIYRHYFWFLKRQVTNLWKPRKELVPSCKETSIAHTLSVLKKMKSMHKQMRPEVIRILSKEPTKQKVVHVKSVRTLNRMLNSLRRD
jgi:adenylate kinase family enzyme